MAKAAYVWDGTQFISLNVPVGAVPNSVLTYSPSAPSSPTTGMTWFDTSTSTIKIYNGTTWVSATSPGSSYQSSQPTSAQTGQLWVNSNTSQVSVFTGSTWVPADAYAIQLNGNTISQNYSLPAGYNGVSAGPITISSGVVVTIPDGAAWSIV